MLERKGRETLAVEAKTLAVEAPHSSALSQKHAGTGPPPTVPLFLLMDSVPFLSCYLLFSEAECLVFHGEERRPGGFMEALQEHKFCFIQTDIIIAHG